MPLRCVLRTVTAILCAAAMLWSQVAHTTVIRPGKLFDQKLGQTLANQVVLLPVLFIGFGIAVLVFLSPAG